MTAIAVNICSICMLKKIPYAQGYRANLELVYPIYILKTKIVKILCDRCNYASIRKATEGNHERTLAKAGGLTTPAFCVILVFNDITRTLNYCPPELSISFGGYFFL